VVSVDAATLARTPPRTTQFTAEESREILERLWQTPAGDGGSGGGSGGNGDGRRRGGGGDGRPALRFEAIQEQDFHEWLQEYETLGLWCKFEGMIDRMVGLWCESEGLPNPASEVDEDTEATAGLWSTYQRRLERLSFDISTLPSVGERVFIAAYLGGKPTPRFVLVVDKADRRHCSFEALAWEPSSPGTHEQRLADMDQLLDWLSEEWDCDPFFFDIPEDPDREIIMWSGQ
jgi:hypothetical protein